MAGTALVLAHWSLLRALPGATRLARALSARMTHALNVGQPSARAARFQWKLSVVVARTVTGWAAWPARGWRLKQTSRPVP
jgi:hypothetical protein